MKYTRPVRRAQSERDLRSVTALTSVLDGVVRTLVRADYPSLHVLPSVSEHPLAPAWTDLKNIFLSTEALLAARDKARKGFDIGSWVIQAKGLTFHELAHVLYSPARQSTVGAKLDTAGMGQTWNLLEDQRIETLMGATYTPIRAYFRVMLCDLILRADDAHADFNQTMATWWAFIVGRQYLSAELLDTVRDGAEQAMGAKWVQDVEDVVMHYRGFSFPGVSDLRVYNTVETFHKLLAGLPPMDVCEYMDIIVTTGVPEGHNSNKEVDAKSQAQKDAQDAQKGAGRPTTGKGTPDAPAAAEAGERGAGDPDAKGEAGGAAGTALGDNQKAHKYDGPTKVMAAELAHAQSDAIFQRDVTNLTKAYTREAERPERFDPKTLGHQSNYADVAVPPGAKAIARRITNVVQRARVDLEPVWNRRQKSGRLNPRREIEARPEELDVFDKWYPGDLDAVNAEVVLLLDNSSSMDDYEWELTSAAWAVARGLDQLSIKCTTIAFNSYTDLIKPANQRVARTTTKFMSSRGGTMAYGSCKAAREILAESKAPLKIMLVLTDGCWGEPEADEELAKLTNDGVVTVLLGLSSAWAAYGAHGCSYGKDISSPKEIPDVIEKALTDAVRHVVKRVTLTEGH